MHVSSADLPSVAAVACAERFELGAVGRTAVAPTAADIAGVVAVVDVADVAVVADAVVDGDVACSDTWR